MNTWQTRARGSQLSLSPSIHSFALSESHCIFSENQEQCLNDNGMRHIASSLDTEGTPSLFTCSEVRHNEPVYTRRLARTMARTLAPW